MIKLANNRVGVSRIKPWLPIFLLLGLTGALYIPFRSIALDDFDAYSFAMALEHFDLTLQQPQPPGFPLYIFLGRLLATWLKEPVVALTTLSALSGIGSVLLIYSIGRTLAPQQRLVGTGAATMFALVPMSWLTAEKALSDMPGLMGTLLALWLLWLGAHKASSSVPCLALGGLAAGLSLGLRPQNALPILLLGAWIIIRTWLKKLPLKPILTMSGGVLLGILIWLLPLLNIVGGLTTYLALLKAHATHVGQADALIGMGIPLGEALRARALAFGDTFLTYTIGVELFSPWEITNTLRAIALALVLGPAALAAVTRKDWWQEATYGLIIWVLAMTAQVFLFETLDRPRLMLPILPPLTLLIAWGWALLPYLSKVSRPRRGVLWPQALALCTIALALLIQGTPLVAQLSQVPAPPAQACDYVAARYAPAETLIATAGSFRAAQVELPNYSLFYLYRFNAEAIKTTLAREPMRYVVIFDRDQFPETAMEVLSDRGRWVPLEEHTFSRDRRVHTQHDQVRVQVLTPASMVPLTALTLPQNGCIDIGGEADGRYLGRGWFRPEIIGGVQGRWAGGTLTSTVRFNLIEAPGYRLHFRALAYPAEQIVRVYIGETPIAQLSLPQGWTEFEIALPQGLWASGQVTTLTFVHSQARAPFEVTGGGSSDTRRLSAAYDRLCLIRE